MIRLTVPSIDQADLEAVSSVLSTGLLVQGAHVKRFEQAVADRVGVAHAVAVSNCTAALHLSLLALGVGADDQVLTTAYSFPATANAIELCGARPVFVDIEPQGFNADPNRIEETLERLMASPSRRRAVKAILPVHAFGQMADMRAITEIARRYELPVIEDAACALGATRNEQEAGAGSQAGCFSFHPRKAITTGEGGMIVTGDADLAARVRTLRNHGQDSTAPSPVFAAAGFNYRLTDFQGALGVSQMLKLDRIIAARRQRAAVYDRLLASTPFRAPAAIDQAHPVYQSYVILLPAEAAARRERAIGELRNAQIETTIGTWHIPMTDFYRQRYGCKTGSFPVADDVFARALTLPLHECLSEDEQAFVCQELERVVLG